MAESDAEEVAVTESISKEATETIAEEAAETIAEEVAEKAAEAAEAVAEVAAETVAEEMAENITEEVAETEIITVKVAERQRPRRWSRGRDQGLDIVANKGPPQQKVIKILRFFLGGTHPKKLKKKHGSK